MPWLRSWLRARTNPRPVRPRLSVVPLEDRSVPAAVGYTTVNSWGSGLQGEVAITNPTGPAVTGWQLSFDYGGTVSDVWNAKLVSRVGTKYTFADAGWNASVPVGGKATFGFVSTASAAPANYVLNGVPLENGTSPPPAPVTVSISGGSVTEADPTATTGRGFLRTSGNQIVDQNGSPVVLSGVNWFGLGTETFAPHGLWARGYKEMMDQMKQTGFNLIRLPFASADLDPGRVPNGIDFSKNPDLVGLNPLQIMDKVVSYAGQVGLRVMLDHHRSEVGSGADGGLWYVPNTVYTEARWVSDWSMLAARYAGNPTVIGADLHNEPHGPATWGSGNPATDWRLAAEKAGNAALAANPNWLIVVEGVESGPGGNYWWGGNLSAAGQFPVRLNVPNRLVYSPHDYPASVYPQAYFSAPNYPNNLPAVWDAQWGYLFKQNVAPILLGEFGTKLETASDKQWFDKITAYLGGDLDTNGTNDLPAGKLGMSWTYWSWNPNSGDTGGILADDWRTVRTDKLAKLQPIQFELLDAGGTSTGGNRSIAFMVTLSGPGVSPVTVSYATQGDTATAGSDFTAASGTLTFAPGETTKTVVVTVLPDDLAEGTETFTVALSTPAGATLGTAAATGTILDDDTTSPPPPPPPPPPLPTVSVGNVSANEGNATNTLTFTVRLSAASASPVTVRFATQNGTAAAGSDYTAATGTVTFLPGETQKSVAVTVLGDSTVEPDETFALVLSAPTGATLGTATGTATLVNDDVLPPPPPPPPPTGSGVMPSVQSNWGTGIVMEFAVKNTTATGWKDWTVEFDAPFTITNIWSGVLVSRVGTRTVIRAESWNKAVAPGATVTFGFQATTAGGNATVSNLILKPVV